MNRGLLIKGGFILGLAALSLFAFYPPKDRLNLGLDLQGGAHLLLEMDTAKLKTDWIANLREDARKALREIGYDQ